MNQLATSSLIDAILHDHRQTWSGGDDVGWSGYRNHAQRVFLFARELIGPDPEQEEQIAIAAAFHDIAVFQTLDYLVPNLEAMDVWLADYGRQEWRKDIGLAMTLHHRVRPYQGEGEWLVEGIRRADWVEVSGGLVHSGIPGELVRRARRELPMGSFATKSAMRIAGHAVTHPLNPMPFWRSRNAVGRARAID